MRTENLDPTSCPPEMAFVDLLEGRLAGADADRVEDHVARCPACRDLLGELSSRETREGSRAREPGAGAGSDPLLVARALDLVQSGPRVGPAARRVGTTIDRKYVLHRMLGRGGMGAVYEAEHTATGRRVALKLIHGHLLERSADAEGRFRREARAAGATDSPHIVAILDAGEDDATGDLYLVMELLHGEDLQQLVDRVGPLRPDVALRVASQALAGLSQAHEAGIVHRDIKPANLFLARQGGGEITVKILDFGVAKVKKDALRAAQSSGLTETGSLLGSPLYMSPEQMQSKKSLDHRTDIWSLGSALYAALTGRAPFHHVGNVLELALAVRSAEGPPPVRRLAPWVPPEVAEIVRRAVAVDPEQRWPSAAAMLAAIREIVPGGVAVREEMLEGVSPEVRAASPRDARRRLRGAPLGAAAIAVAAVAGYAGLRRSPPPPAPRAVAPVSSAPTIPPPTPSLVRPPDPLRRVTVQVSPEDARVEVDGAPARVQDGAFEIAGALGSSHRVRAVRGRSEVSTDVFVTEKGAVPARVELAPPDPPAAAAKPVGVPSAHATSRAKGSVEDPMRKPE